jgi:hypothetical protein
MLGGVAGVRGISVVELVPGRRGEPALGIVGVTPLELLGGAVVPDFRLLLSAMVGKIPE